VTGLVLIQLDVTERKKAQREAARSAQLASVGQLAAGVAHEINNPVNGIINYARILRDTYGGEGNIGELAGRITAEGERVAGIVAGLLSFARDHRHEERCETSVSTIVRETLSLLEGQFTRDGIEIRMKVPADLPALRVAPHETRQVFLNVFSNAQAALNQKYPGIHRDKILEISAARASDNGESLLRIEVTDRGAGIPAEHLDKVFEPFFTTKTAEQGTGLGLSISHGIIEAQGGKIEIKSVPGEFTTVGIVLPIFQEDNSAREDPDRG